MFREGLSSKVTFEKTFGEENETLEYVEEKRSVKMNGPEVGQCLMSSQSMKEAHLK